MTVRGTLVLAAVFAGLVAYLALTRPTLGLREAAEARLTPPLDAATVVQIVRGTEVTEFAKRDGVWSERVADFLDGLGSLTVLGVIDPAPSDPASFGLGADAPRLRVLSEQGELATIEVGTTNPAGTGLYVRRVGQPPVLLVGALLQWELEKLRRVASTTALP